MYYLVLESTRDFVFLLELGSPFLSTGRTFVCLRKAEQYGLYLSLGLVEEGREPWSLTRSEVCVRVRDYIIQSGCHPMKFWFSVVPTLPFTSLGYECAMSGSSRVGIEVANSYRCIKDSRKQDKTLRSRVSKWGFAYS
uniref:Uncharacterized protein n=1 Tax=Lepeophtheirus salmonis TaxID=72036 RepID=A0A0K2UZS2_LEPSM